MARDMPQTRLTHLDAANRPTMVDVGAKTATLREATAEATVKLPPAVARELARTGHRTKKGPVFDTAIVAGVMAAKKHARDRFRSVIRWRWNAAPSTSPTRPGGRIRIVCSVAVHHKTGVEMEALVGASAAALTIYDMCKALSHDIEIEPDAPAAQDRRQARLSTRTPTEEEHERPAYPWPGARGRPQHAHAARQGRHRIPRRRDAARRRDEVAGGSRGARLSCRCAPISRTTPHARATPQIVDRGDIEGPIAGISAAFASSSGCRLAGARLRPALPRRAARSTRCSLARDPGFDATAFRSSHDGLPEPLCAIYEPRARDGDRRANRRRQELPAQIPHQRAHAAARPAQSARARQREHRGRV